jgi:hypothetical protein
VADIFNLVDSCNQNSILFRLASERSPNEDFRAFANRTRQTLDRFSYELQTEIRRIGSSEFDSSRTYSEPREDPDLLSLRCEISLKVALDEYQRVYDCSLHAHARAMLKRQRSEIQQAYDQLVQIRRVA